MNDIRKLWLALCCASAVGIASAAGGAAQPLSWSGGLRPLEQIAASTFAELDIAQVAAEDAQRELDGRPHRFAIPHDVSIDSAHAGTWEQHADRSIWRYRVKAAGAASLNFGFTQFHLPTSAHLYVYDAQHRQVAGPYDANKKNPHGQLWTPVIAADDVVIELDVASAHRNQVELVLGRINQGYRGLGRATKGYQQPDLGQSKGGKTVCSPEQINSGTCNMDVACLDESDPWNDPRRAVGAITLGGSDDCTGSLINNTANDRRMLFITASHCELTAASSPSVVVYWNYEWPTCRTPGSAASGQSNPPDPNMTNSGATYLANTPSPFDSGCNSSNNTKCSDNTLVELDDPANPDFNLYWEGWDRRTIAAACSQSDSDPASTDGLCASIHHPAVDEKRITFVARDLEVGGITNGVNTHWHAYWDPNPPILPNIPSPQPATVPPGVTEPGSSGSPLYTADKRLVGVLSGGPSACGATGENLSDFYGQLALAWDGLGTPTTRLKDYLDPLGGAPDFIDGLGMSPFQLAVDPVSVAVCASATSATIAVSVSADPGFSDAVALSASGEPAGSTATFAPASVTPPADASLVIGALAGATPGSYQLTVTGTSGADSVSKTVPFTLNGAAPAAATLTSPADGASAIPTAPTLSWSVAGSSGPTDYLVEIATDAAFGAIVFSQSVRDATSIVVAPPLTSSTTYYWRVTAGNACGTAAVSATFQFRTLTAPGDCEAPTQPTTVFSDDIENGGNGWSTDGGSGASNWTISTARPYSGTHAWYADDIDSISDQRLLSPVIALPTGQNPLTLQFQNWREIEASSSGCFDGGIVEASTDGTTFTQVPNSAIISGGSYDGVISSQYDNPLATLSAWCTNTARPYEDGPVRVDVTSYAGQNVQFRFRLGTDNSTSHEGWYVDDVSVSSCSASTEVIFTNGFETTP